MTPLDFSGMIMTFLSLTYANIGGLGGGGLIVPVSQGFFRLDVKNAIALSNASIFLSSVIRFLLFASTPHPKKNGKGLIVDHNLSILMLPMLISGVSFGVLANIILPEPVVMIVLVLIMGYLSYGMFAKASAMRIDENKKLADIVVNEDDVSDQKKVEELEGEASVIPEERWDQAKVGPEESIKENENQDDAVAEGGDTQD